MQKKIAVTGIGTDVGKTVVSAILAESLSAYYWKPVQAGDLDNSDSIKVDRLTDNVKVLPERFRLSQPMSPHAAADIDHVHISIMELTVPEVDGNLIIEGAGGLMVPFNSEGLLFADLLGEWRLPVIIVSKNYLGSINHTLLTVEILQKRGVQIEGIVFVGEENPSTEEIIIKISGLRVVARIPWTNELTKDFVKQQAEKIQWDN